MAHDTEELAFTPAVELARLIRDRTISPVEVVDTFLHRIDELDPQIGAYVVVDAERVRDDARRAEAAVVANAELGPLHGVPVSIKSMIAVTGTYTTLPTFSEWVGTVARRDAAVVTKLQRAGCLLLGKTRVTSVLGNHGAPPPVAGFAPEDPLFRRGRNPWNLQRGPGGSSGGSGAAVAAGLCPVSLGGDDGGSIRIPGSWCGAFGIKPSRGRVSAAPDASAMHFTAGPLARTVADAAATLDAISGYVTGDAFWAPPPERPFAAEVGRDPGRLRIAFTTAAGDGVIVDPDNIAAVQDCAATLTALGHHIEELHDWPGRGMFPDPRALGIPGIYAIKWAAAYERGELPPTTRSSPTCSRRSSTARRCAPWISSRRPSSRARWHVASSPSSTTTTCCSPP
jgi:amidase